MSDRLAAGRAAVDQPAGDRPRVLIVDDEPSNVRVLAEALRDHYALSFARRGDEALELASRIAFDLILLDVVMPGMDGHAVLDRLRTGPVTRGIPVIFVTARDELDDEAAGLERGAVDYIAKPINPAIVRARVRTHVALKRQRDLLANLADRDGLTGIANRRYFDRQLDRRWHRRARQGRGLGLLVIDIDHFKQYNDHYGHADGDDCLRIVARRLEQLALAADGLAARYGGEEFAMACDEGAAAELGAAVCHGIRELELAHAASPVATHVTVSAGVATVTYCIDHDQADLFRRADQLLYNAKAAGRDRWETGSLDVDDPAREERKR